MIELNGRGVQTTYFPDRTPSLRVDIGAETTQTLTWLFDGMEELVVLSYITRHLQAAGKSVRLIMPYIPNARMDRVANTCNLSEDWIGYSTLFGDSADQFAPLADLTVAEVKAVGRALGIPDNLIDKVPADGLCEKTDEENLGFTYDQLDTYIRTGVCKDPEVKAKIDRLHIANRFKLLPMPRFSSGLPIEVPA